MIGLIKGLAFQAYVETRLTDRYIWESWLKRSPVFGLITSRKDVASGVANPEQAFATSFRFFELIEACPLRIPFNG